MIGHWARKAADYLLLLLTSDSMVRHYTATETSVLREAHAILHRHADA